MPALFLLWGTPVPEAQAIGTLHWMCSWSPGLSLLTQSSFLQLRGSQQRLPKGDVRSVSEDLRTQTVLFWSGPLDVMGTLA